MEKAFVDMDGVLVDFVKGACERHGRSLDLPALKGRWDFYRQWEMSDTDFWRLLDGESFFAGLDWTEDGRTLLAMIEAAFGPKNVYLCSSPPHDPASSAGKVAWIYKHLPGYARRFILTPCKTAVSGPGKLLIDDSDKNVAEWCLFSGGCAITVPRPWNTYHEGYFASGATPQVQMMLKAHLIGRN